jgi:hypothetical protein
VSWASARAAHGLDEGERVEGPHEVGYRWIWRIATAAMIALVALFAVALVLAVLYDGFGAGVPDAVNSGLTLAALIVVGFLMGILPAMWAVDRVDRRWAWRDDELQAALSPDHSLARR